jgi:hypothetical protein
MSEHSVSAAPIAFSGLGFFPCLVEASHHNKRGIECDQTFGLFLYDLNKSNESNARIPIRDL